VVSSVRSAIILVEWVSVSRKAACYRLLTFFFTPFRGHGFWDLTGYAPLLSAPLSPEITGSPYAVFFHPLLVPPYGGMGVYLVFFVERGNNEMSCNSIPAGMASAGPGGRGKVAER